MKYRADQIERMPKVCIDGKWVIKRKKVESDLFQRIEYAIGVIKRRYDVIEFYKQ